MAVMTRDEQIAQLKPGAHVMMGDRLVSVSYLFLRHTKPFVECFSVGGDIRVFHDSDLLLPDPPLAAKAMPGVRYIEKNKHPIYAKRRVGAAGGQLTDGWGFEPFDPAVWMPLDTPEDAK